MLITFLFEALAALVALMAITLIGFVAPRTLELKK
jgi:hypothetical protein